MRLFILLSFMVMGSCAPIMAAQHDVPAGMCYRISDSDSRTACLARAHKDPSRCYAVRNLYQRELCFFEAKK